MATHRCEKFICSLYSHVARGFDFNHHYFSLFLKMYLNFNYMSCEYTDMRPGAPGGPWGPEEGIKSAGAEIQGAHKQANGSAGNGTWGFLPEQQALFLAEPSLGPCHYFPVLIDMQYIINHIGAVPSRFGEMAQYQSSYLPLVRFSLQHWKIEGRKFSPFI